MTSNPRVCVIGAGAAGLAALRALDQKGIDATAFEKSSAIGGHWNDGYDALYLITEKNLCGFDGFPMPEDYPMFPHRDQIISYMNAFADRYDLRRLVKLSTAVSSLRPLGDRGIDGWEVHTSDSAVHRFASVIIANGHYSERLRPDLKGEFLGKQIYARDYRRPTDLAGSRVLVIGAGNSGCDIAVDTAQAGLETTISMRHGHVFQPKTLFGQGRTTVLPDRLPVVIRERLLRHYIRATLGTADNYPGMPRPANQNIYKNKGIINSQLLYWIHHGRINVAPGIDRILDRTVIFENGTAREFDSIVLATGYKIGLPFLDPELLQWAGDHPLRHAEGTLFPKLANLYVIGLVGPTGAQWPVYDRQAVVVLRLMRLQQTLPTPVADHLAHVERPWEDVDMERHVWDRRAAQAERTLRKLERRSLRRVARR